MHLNSPEMNDNEENNVLYHNLKTACQYLKCRLRYRLRNGKNAAKTHCLLALIWGREAPQPLGLRSSQNSPAGWPRNEASRQGEAAREVLLLASPAIAGLACSESEPRCRAAATRTFISAKQSAAAQPTQSLLEQKSSLN